MKFFIAVFPLSQAITETFPCRIILSAELTVSVLYELT